MFAPKPSGFHWHYVSFLFFESPGKTSMGEHLHLRYGILLLRMNKTILLYVAWIQALVATILSLIFSEFFHFLPCVLCWYQRICMYPLVVILTVGILRRDKTVASYVLPLSIIGMVISFYHNLVYYHLIPEQITPCTIGAACDTRFISLFGFITIPLLSFTAFTLITFCMIMYNRQTHEKRT